LKPAAQQQQVWPGWLGALSTPANGTKYRLTWDEWCARQRDHSQRQPVRRAGPPPGRDEVAVRAFLLWFDAAATNSGRHDPPFDDRELAVRRYMHNVVEVAATLDQFSGTELARLRLLRRRTGLQSG
jgi:hypothetical protein